MTEEEYRARAAAETDWAPGWSAIDEAFDGLYPGVTPAHLATLMPARAMFGGEEYLDGTSIFPSPNGYQHLVTYGMSALYADVGAFGGEFSGWGYEMTMKVRADGPEDTHWAVSSMAGLARYTYTSKRWFEPFQFISGQGRPLRIGGDTLLTSYVVVPDTEVAGIETAHGRVDFLQLVGVTQRELDWIADGPPGGAPERARELAALLAERVDPRLVTDLARTQSLV